MSKIEILERLRLSYLTDKENTMNTVNKMINNHSVFPVDEKELKEKIDKLAIIEMSLEQVNYFIAQLSQKKNDGNSTERGHADPVNS